MEAQVKSKSAPTGLEASPNYVRILNDAEWFILGYAQAQGGPRPSGRPGRPWPAGDAGWFVMKCPVSA